MPSSDRYRKLIYIYYGLTDVVLLNISFFISALIYYRGTIWINSRFYPIWAVFNLLWFLSTFIFKAYETRLIFDLTRVLLNTFKSLILHLLLVALAAYAFKFSFYGRLTFLTTYAFLFVLIPASRIVILKSLKLVQKLGYGVRNVVIIGYNQLAEELKQYVSNYHNIRYKFLGYFDDENQSADVVGTIASFEQFAAENDIHELYCCLPLNKTEEIYKIVDIADRYLIRMRIVPDFQGFLWRTRRINLSFVDRVPILTFRDEPLELLRNQILKRAFDIAFSLGVIIFLMPIILPIISIMVYLDSPGPIFFRQLRTGKNNKEFACYKFRTMRVNKDSDLKQAQKNDPRITKVGAFLRKSNLDELPQFFNVLVGDMSVVGPRPHMLKHTEEYSKIISKFMVRHLVKPGITGWAQVRGFRGNTNEPELMEKRVEHDVWYIENWSLWLDLYIIYLTVYNMFKGEENAF